MTLNPIHIKMFAEADKIQKGWKPEVGDRVWVATTNQIAHIGGIKENIKLVEDFPWIDRSQDIFLPSIEQMAEMLWVDPSKDADSFMWVYLFHKWCTDSYNDLKPKKCPLEILVLMFVQSDIHGLTWSDTEEGWHEET